MKRVALDFEWPLGKTWEGFLNPHYVKCPHCESGSTTAMDRLMDLVSLLMLSGSDAVQGKCHPYFHEAPLHRTAGKVPSKDMAELTTGLAGRSPSAFGHDSMDNWSATSKIVAAAGLPESWGVCQTCHGDCIHPNAKQAYDAWMSVEPPAGEGWQVWETVSEGSPVTPVMPTRDALIEYLVAHGDRWDQKRGDPGWTRANAESFVEDGFAMSLLVEQTATGAKMYEPRDGAPT